MLILLCFLLVGCGCKHQWQTANCQAPKTCSACGETEGEALGHTWANATCEAPKTCSVCQKTEGEALGHKWAGATCTKEGTCSVCHTTGKKADHTFVITYDQGERYYTFASYRKLLCTQCNLEKKEYYANGNVYDLDAIEAELKAYVLSLGYQLTDEKKSPYVKDWNTGANIWDPRLTDGGANYLISCGKKSIDAKHNYYRSMGAVPGDAWYIKVSYGESGALGGGSFTITVK